jgi:hypothetical protein
LLLKNKLLLGQELAGLFHADAVNCIHVGGHYCAKCEFQCSSSSTIRVTSFEVAAAKFLACMLHHSIRGAHSHVQLFTTCKYLFVV